MANEANIESTQQPIPDMVGLSVDAALINRLGYELVGRAETAVSELIKNAYDADARKVDVFFKDTEQTGGVIIVRDNGTGMDYEKLKNGFLRISTSDKVDHPNSERYNRPRAGRKGIGRFATQRIGDGLTIITCRADMDFALKVSIDWRAFQPKTDLGTILFPIEKVAKTQTEGTELIISDVRDAWNDTAILRVHRYVMELFQPDYLGHVTSVKQSENTFETYFWKWMDDKYEIIQNGQEDFFSKALAVISGKIGDNERGVVKVKSDSLVMNDEMLMDDAFPLLKNVQFKAYYFIYERPEYYSNGVSSTMLKTINKVANTASGIRLYRNGFRVLPYGDPSNDWINLNVRWAGSSGINIPFGTRNLFGYVELVDQEGKRFDETSSREGLIENEAFVQLKDFLYKAFTMARNRISSSPELQHLKEGRGVADPTEPQPDVQEDVKEKLKVIRNYVRSKTEEAGSEGEQQQQRVYELLNSVERTIDELEMLRVLAGLGLSIGAFSHEMEQFKPSLMGDLAHMIRNDLPMAEIASSLNRHLETMFAYTQFFNITVSENLNRSLGPVDVLEIVDKFHTTIENDLERQQISYNFHPFSFTLMTGPMHEAELISVLFNLYTNSRKAIIKNNQPGSILITAGIDNQTVWLCFQDNGIGVPDENRERIFDAFFTTSTPASFESDEKTKLTGTGLGLKIVKDIVTTRGGRIFLETPDAGYNTNFKIILPRA